MKKEKARSRFFCFSQTQVNSIIAFVLTLCQLTKQTNARERESYRLTHFSVATSK